MKNVNKTALSIAIGAMMSITGVAFADGHKSHEHKVKDHAEVKTVTVETSDKTLMAGKDKETMFKVLQPSVRLVINIEGVDHDIKMASAMGVTTLYVTDASQEDIESIRKTYAEISNSDNFDIKLVSADEKAPYKTLEELSDS